MSYPPRTVDTAEAILKSRGWSVGDASYIQNQRGVWLVTCIRGVKQMTAEASSQLAAWQHAVSRADAFRLRFGPYSTPRFRYGAVVECDVRGSMRIVSLSSGRIPWPEGISIERPRRRSLVVYKGLAKAVKLEASIVVQHWWGVSPATVRKWRRALGVSANTKGTTTLRRLYGQEGWFKAAQRKAWSLASAPERCAKIAAARLGKKRPKHIVAAMRRRQLGKRLSEETRYRMSEAHKRRRTRPPWLNPPWVPWEDEFVRTLPAKDASQRTGRSLSAVWNRRQVLRRLDRQTREAKTH